MSVYSILSFDPGLSTLGWAFSIYDSQHNKFTVKKYGTYKASKTASKQKDDIEVYGQRFIALNLLEQEIIKLIDFYKPDYVTSEDVFLHIKHVNAFIALTLCLHTIRRAAFSKNKLLYTMAPCDIKKVTTDTGTANKEAIQKAVLTNKNIVLQESKPKLLIKMCEHEADAIAVGYSFAVSILPTIILENHENANILIEEVLPKKINKVKLNKKKTK